METLLQQEVKFYKNLGTRYKLRVPFNLELSSKRMESYREKIEYRRQLEALANLLAPKNIELNKYAADVSKEFFLTGITTITETKIRGILED